MFATAVRNHAGIRYYRHLAIDRTDAFNMNYVWSNGHYNVRRPSASARQTTVAWELRSNGVTEHHVIRPHTFHLMVGGPNVKVTHMSWSSWGSRTARGTGRAYASDLHGWESIGRVTIVFHHVISGSMRSPSPFFYKLHLIGGRDIIHHWHWQMATAVLPGGWQG